LGGVEGGRLWGWLAGKLVESFGDNFGRTPELRFDANLFKTAIAWLHTISWIKIPENKILRNKL
jgi:hypothetical protein